MKPSTEKVVLAGILISGALALFAKSAGASQGQPSGPKQPAGAPWDPGALLPGVPRVQTQTRFVGFISVPVDVYEWGAFGQSATLIVASDDPSSFVAYVPTPGAAGGVTRVLARGTGRNTASMLAALHTA